MIFRSVRFPECLRDWSRRTTAFVFLAAAARTRLVAAHFASAFHGFIPFGVLDVAGDSVQVLAKAIAEQ